MIRSRGEETRDYVAGGYMHNGSMRDGDHRLDLSCR